MSRIWRTIAPVAIAGGLIAAGVLPAQAAGGATAQPAATPTVTIAAKSVFQIVTHDVFVMYKAAGNIAVVTIKGEVTGATTGEVAALYAQRFPYTAAPALVPGQQLTLTPVGSTPVPYRFTASPVLATKYTVKILPSSSSTTPVASSAVQNVYVVTKQKVLGFKPTCHRPVCHETIRIYTTMPTSAFRKEESKRTYFYFGLKLSSTGEPGLPKWLYLDKRAKISKPVKVSADEFEIRLSWSFTIGNDGYAFAFRVCSKDTESSDGINLPGSHWCGRPRVQRVFSYLG